MRDQYIATNVDDAPERALTSITSGLIFPMPGFNGHVLASIIDALYASTTKEFVCERKR
jgi:hypothetical protein